MRRDFYDRGREETVASTAPLGGSAGTGSYGMKQSDGMNRCLMLRGYENEAISNTNKVYPLSKWKKSDVMAYIKAKKLPEPISYNKNKSQGLTFLPEVFDYLPRHYPQDLEKIYKVFPLSRNILLRYDEEKRAAAQIQAK